MINIKRWKVKTDKGYEMLLFYKTLEDAQARNPNCEIEKSDDYRYLEYIYKLLKLPHEIKYDYRGREILKYNIKHNTVYVRLFKEDDFYLDGLQYQEHKDGRFINPITWTMSTPQELYEEVFIQPISVARYSVRLYGQPKLPKPKELKGIEKAFSIDFLKNCSCQCFIKDNDLWIKHRDYFSRSIDKLEDSGTPLEYRIEKYGLSSKKSSGFIYNDCWGSVIGRNEAWLIIKDVVPHTAKCNEVELSTVIIDEFCKMERMSRYDLDENWGFFFEKISKELLKIN